MRVLVSTVRLPVVVALPPRNRSPVPRLKPEGLVVPITKEADVVAAPLTLNVESKVEEALTKMPAVVEVGVRVG